MTRFFIATGVHGVHRVRCAKAGTPVLAGFVMRPQAETNRRSMTGAYENRPPPVNRGLT